MLCCAFSFLCYYCYDVCRIVVGGVVVVFIVVLLFILIVGVII